MYVDITLSIFIIVVVALGYYTRRVVTTRKCINCRDWVSFHEGVNMQEGFVCSECLYKTSYPLPDEDEDGQAEHAEEYYAGVEEHERQRRGFEEEMHINGIPIEDWFVDTIDTVEACIAEADAAENTYKKELIQRLMAGESFYVEGGYGVHGEDVIDLHNYCPAPFWSCLGDDRWDDFKEWTWWRYSELGWFGYPAKRLLHFRQREDKP